MSAEARKSRLASSNVSNAIAGNSLNFEDGKVVETPRDFLHSCGANKLLLEAMASVVQSRPKDPIAFLSEHFASLLEPKSSFQNAIEKLRSIPYTKDIFESVIVDAYQGFREKRGKDTSGGLQGAAHNELMIALLKETPIIFSEKILKCLMKPEKQSISLRVFRNSVMTILIFEDLIKTAKSIYAVIDFTDRQRADKKLCLAVIEELSSMFLDPSYKGINIAILQSKAREDSNEEYANRSVMNMEEFLKSAVEIFIKGVV